MTLHQFGGDWTEQKLDRLRKYLPAFMKVMHRHPVARQHFRTMYVDAFAGTGYRQPKSSPSGELIDFALEYDEDEALASPETRQYLEGSALIALETDPPFDYYLFIDKKSEHVRDLQQLKLQYINLPSEIDVQCGEANQVLAALCENTDWREWRGVVFIDPYGMALDWATIQMLAQRAKIDLWLLFPIGQAVNRLLTKGGEPPPQWAAKLDRFFGVPDWREAFYKTQREVEVQQGQLSLLDADDVSSSAMVKVANFGIISAFFEARLKTVFSHVTPPLPLYNSTGEPLYLLCFASHSPAAMSIASDLV